MRSVIAREYLEQIAKNERIIKNKQYERDFWLGMATNTTAKLGGERVQTSGNKQTMEHQVIEAIQAEEDINRLKQEIADIISTIQRLSAEDYDLLHQVYVQHKSLKEIHIEAERSYSWATTTHQRALERLQRLLDNEKGAGA